jgi:hypothetical protein
MRCRACNKNLNDFESTRKADSGEFVDLCNHCYHEVQSEVLAEERQDLQEGNDEMFDDDEWIELDFDIE